MSAQEDEESKSSTAVPLLVEPNGPYTKWKFLMGTRYRFVVVDGTVIEARFRASIRGTFDIPIACSMFVDSVVPGHPDVDIVYVDHTKPLDEPATLMYVPNETEDTQVVLTLREVPTVV